MISEVVTGNTCTSRRGVLLAAGGSLAAGSGCLDRFRRTAEREEPSQVAVEILTLPDDADPHAVRIANHLASTLMQVGIDVDVIPRREEVFLRQVLINQNFDLYVWRHPPQQDPDFLRPLLHSRFAEEPGWQNPFGFSNSMIDELLDDQLVQGPGQRIETLATIQSALEQEHPFVPIAFLNDHRLSQTERVRVPSSIPVSDAAWILSLHRPTGTDHSTCRLGTTDWRLTHNLNPIAVEYRGGNGVIDLLYDSITRRWGTDYIPWLAESWRWTSPIGASAPTLEIQIRDGLRWHDDKPLTAEDVAFSYRFLADTTMTDEDPVVPAPKFRGRTSIIDSTEAVDDSTVRVQFKLSSRAIARLSLTLPILPQHIWSDRTELTDVAGITIAEATTDALIHENLDPIGSGPFRIHDVDRDEQLELIRVDDHFSWTDEFRASIPTGVLTDFERFVVDVRPSASNIAESIREGGLAGSLTGLSRTHATTNDDTELTVNETSELFHIGFNVREIPLTGHGFRNAIARLVDRQFVLEEIFEGGARPAISPVANTDVVPDDLQWKGPQSARFLGESGTGDVEVEAARDMFRDAGFQYTEDGELLSR